MARMLRMSDVEVTPSVVCDMLAGAISETGAAGVLSMSVDLPTNRELVVTYDMEGFMPHEFRHPLPDVCTLQTMINAMHALCAHVRASDDGEAWKGRNMKPDPEQIRAEIEELYKMGGADEPYYSPLSNREIVAIRVMCEHVSRAIESATKGEPR